MNPDENKIPKPLDLESLETELRHLPAPTVPDDLEAKLVAAIPAASAPPPRKGRPLAGRWRPAGAAIAAGLLLAIGLLLSSKGRIDRTGPSARLGDTAPTRIVRPTNTNPEKETRPCDILPPLPYPLCSSC